MERMIIDDDFKDWIVLHLPLHVILSMWDVYSETFGKPISEEEIREFEKFLKNYKKDL